MKPGAVPLRHTTPGGFAAGRHDGNMVGIHDGDDVSPDTVWAEGYVSDVPYTLGFYRELAPSLLNYACLINGFEGMPSGRKLRYCELGCGRGYGTSLLAASNPDIDFVAIDFNASHIAEAKALADRANIANIRFLDMDFADAARSSDPQLAEFDIVVMHGVYAWVPSQVQEAIHEFLRAKLVSGGLCFVSYNAMPGWARVVPTQRLLVEVAKRAGGDSLARVGKGMELLRLLVEQSDGLLSRHGTVSRTYLAQLEKKDPHYLVHEFLNAGWQPLFATDVFEALAKAGLGYVGSAGIAENRIELCVPKGLRDIVRSMPDAAMREFLKDYVLGKQFRRDIFVKGSRKQDLRDSRQRLSRLRFAAMPHIAAIPDVLRSPIGQMRPAKAVLDAMWRCVRDGPATAADLVGAARKAGEPEERAWAIVELLVQNGCVHPLRDASDQDDRSAAHRLNAVVMELAASSNTHGFLASPVLGTAISANLPERVIVPILARDPDLEDAVVAAQAFDRVEANDHHFIRDGRPVERSGENVQALAQFVRECRERRMPAWRRLGIVG